MTAYRYLIPGEEIKAGDQFKRQDGSWVEISQADKERWEKSFRRILTREPGDKPVRRVSKAFDIIEEDPFE